VQTSTPAWLDEQALAQRGAEAGLDGAALQTLRACAQRIAADRQLQHVATAAHQALFDTATDLAPAMQGAETAVGGDVGLLHALFVLDSLRLIRDRQAARGVPPAMALAVFQRHAGGLLRAAAARGDLGSIDWSPDWLRTVASGALYRLGRLEFLITSLAYPLRVYRQGPTGAVIALAEAGEPFSDEGVGVGPHTWVSTRVETEEAIVATAISPQGRALRQAVRLPRAAWHLVLQPGDPILDLHVPEEEPLTIAALHDAHTQAATFFARYYPDHPFRAYLCDSWLFSPQLEAMLGPDSNIVRWQQEGYLLPDDSEGEGMLEFTFGALHIDTAVAPRDTRLRRALIAHLEQGKRLCCGRYLFLREDLQRFGTQPYRDASAHAIAQHTVPAP
jgi:hypothetical protein